MKEKHIQRFSIALLIIGSVITFYLLRRTFYNGFNTWSNQAIDFAVTGQFGDFIGGVVGTLFSLSGTLLIYLTFREQAKQNEIGGFESTFFEMIRLHRENIKEITYTKYDEYREKSTGEGLMSKSKSRKVFKVIYSEFIECFKEIKKYPVPNKDISIIKPDYMTKLHNIRTKINPLIDLNQMAMIDISYSIIYYGLSSEGRDILKSNFMNKYDEEYTKGLLNFMRLKPKLENKTQFHKWNEIIKKSGADLKSEVDKIYGEMKERDSDTSDSNDSLISSEKHLKYYGGHQHRLGHYYRHLFQSYKYLNSSTFLTVDQKYFYGKTLRAQLSTYEQALLLINSISSLGMKWEYIPDVKNTKSGERTDIITTYHLIKNLPGIQIDSFVYKTYYPNVEYEKDE